VVESRWRRADSTRNGRRLDCGRTTAGFRATDRTTVDLSLTTRTEGDKTVVAVGGEIDVYTAPKLREQIVQLVEDGHYHLVVDMEQVEFLDSTGLGVLVGGLKRVRAHDGSLRLVCTQERILKIFRITGLTKVFPVHASVAEAVAATD
jgi:anti-sigma B factor antagonist